jgi:hypothetical protein
LVIFDAGVIIYLARINKLKSLFKNCKVYLTEIVYSEIKFYTDTETGEKIYIYLESYIESKSLIIIRSIDLEEYNESEIENEIRHIINSGVEIHEGEKEAISFIFNNRKYKLCTGDSGALKFLAYLDLHENAISLETIIGKVKNIKKEYTNEFMKMSLNEGSKLRIQDFQ